MGARILGLGVAVGLLVLGVLLTAFALGWVGGTAIEGSRTYAVVGPLFAGLGVALVVVIAQNRR
ncbi:hypothetical protein KLP28_03270 [Nocardioidaceae bacterium]|nr:hypothetical protein KLP28_03270 [Nocardioidaceae bacterium]